jgi:RHS repeat-associated protein
MLPFFVFVGGKLIATSENGTLRYVHQDSLTSTSLMTDNTGNQIGTTVKYLPFGETRLGSVPTDKLFTGQRLDGTGLYYYNARYYDPTIGRFISADTEGIDYKYPQTLNRYSYCSNNPLRFTDPTGHWPWDFVLTAIKNAISTVVNWVMPGWDVWNNCDYSSSLYQRLTIDEHIISKPDIMQERGWTESQIRDTVKNPYHTSPTTDRTVDPAEPATAYYRSSKPGDYVSVNNNSENAFAIGDSNDSDWKPDSSIKNPPKPPGTNSDSGSRPNSGNSNSNYSGWNSFYFFPIPVAPVFTSPVPAPFPNWVPYYNFSLGW